MSDSASTPPRDRDIDVLVVGDLNPDIFVISPAARPAFGQTETLVETVTMSVGGSSAIVACGAARLGLRTAFIGVVGDDSFGHLMLDALADRGIDTSACITDAALATGASVILVAGGDRAILTAPGTVAALRADYVPADLLGRARHLHVGSVYLQDGLRPGLPGLLRHARAAGATVSLDCNWDPSGRWDEPIDELLVETDLFLPNEAEAQHLTGLADAGAAAAELVRRGRRRDGSTPVVAVKRGVNGGLASTVGGIITRPALAVDVADTTGAGDSFDAGFIFGWLNGWPIAASLELAVACGSLACRGIGGTTSQPTLAEAMASAAAIAQSR